ncbi:hypothetical protein IGI04_025094 [Brassica rapa subsp. trilocularis]|uniref:Uncharacterized protein n=1 Tax=Brassica rapa subsp. trilocularis TaxID=1813537 RepID=A0ABQ7M8M5_BRACM|nr:hypothetical protein IGI04_025094 [Brassica rapa subsp. trilocularis]
MRGGPSVFQEVSGTARASRTAFICGLAMLMWLHFASSIFGGSASIFEFELYFGLLIFVGYMVVDTQEIIEKAHLGDMDYEKHSLTLFTDFVAVFIRILIIMLKNAADKEEKKKKKKKRRN